MNRNRAGLRLGLGLIFAEVFVCPATILAALGPDLSVTATASAVSQYMFRGLRRGGLAFQPYVEGVAGDLTAGVWANLPLRDKVSGNSDPEFDLYGAYTFKLSEAASFAPGFTSYHFPSAPTRAGYYKWTFEPNLAFNYTVQGLRLTPKIYYDTALKGATCELTALYAMPLRGLGSELDFTATVGTYKWTDFANNTGPAVKAWGDYWLVGVALPFQISKQAKLTVGFAYTEGTNAFIKQGRFGKSPNRGAIGRGVATISYAWAF